MPKYDYSFGDFSSEQVLLNIQNELNATPDGGSMKFASDSSAAFIKKNVYEESFARKILPFKPLDPKDKTTLIRLPNTDYPVAMVDVEPTTFPAVTLPFDQSPETRFYYGTKALMYFFKIATPEIQKSIITLNTYPYDIQKVMLDGLLKNMQKQEDFVFTSLCEQSVAASNNKFVFSANLTRPTIKAISKVFLRHGYDHGCNLINATTYTEVTDQSHHWTGDTLQENIFHNGVKALEGKPVGGMKWLSTIKNDIIADNTIFAYTTEDRLGCCKELYKPVVYMKKEKDRVTCSAQEVVGMLLENSIGVAKITINSEDTVLVNSYPQQAKVIKQAD